MTRVWPYDTEQPPRRGNLRGNPYPVSHDRYMASAMAASNVSSSRTYLPSHDSNDHESDHDAKSRKRIPVAVGHPYRELEAFLMSVR
jgi:hypothetical protein